MILMEALVHQRKSSILTLIKQRQNFARVYITVMISYLFVNGKKNL